jgi:hypothetical protein
MRCDQRIDLPRMGHRPHVTGARDDFRPHGRHQVAKQLRGRPGRSRRVFAADYKHRKREARIGGERRCLAKQGREIERCLRHPADDPILHLGAKRIPGAGPAPVVDERGGRPATVAGRDAGVDPVRDATDFREGRSPAPAGLAEHVKRGRLVEREARDAIRAPERDVQREATAIGMPDEVHLGRRRIDERERALGFVGEREGTSPAPRSGAVAAVVFGRGQLVVVAQRLGKPPPLPGTCAGAVERNDMFVFVLHVILVPPCGPKVCTSSRDRCVTLLIHRRAGLPASTTCALLFGSATLALRDGNA